MPQPNPRATLAERYGPDAPLSEQLVSSITPDLLPLLVHRSVRAYAERDLEPGLIEALVVAAQSAATSSNTQIVSVIAVRNADLRDQLSILCGNQEHVRRASVFLVWVVDFTLAAEQAAHEGLRLEQLDYVESLLTGATNAGIAAQNAVVAAEALGLGTVYVGGLRNDMQRVIELLGLPKLTIPIFGLCVGYEDESRPASIKPRLPLSLVLHQDRYSSAERAAGIKAYEDTLRDFYDAQHLERTTWRKQCINRLQGLERLHGRERIRTVLESQGFGFK